MLMGLSKKIELVANVAIIVVACLLGMVLVKSYLLHAPTDKSTQRQDSTPGQNVAVLANEIKLDSLNIDWKRNGQTLLLVVSSSCHFCTESAPFYRQLANGHQRTRLVAVLPQPIDEGKRYLDRLGFAVDDIKQASLSSINVMGTPTLMLVNSDGVVVQTWIGKLPEAQEEDVLRKS